MGLIPVNDIVIGPRIREDKGDIAGMAESLVKYGLIEPILVEGSNGTLSLICGERRLLAARSLGWDLIEATIAGPGMSDKQRFELEREENEQRKALTVGEAAKRYRASTVLVEKAKEVAPRLSSAVSEDRPSRPGRRTYEVPKADVAQALGIGVATLVAAEQHVAAAERYPELSLPGITQEAAITVAKNLDKLPEPEREEKRQALRRFDQKTMAELAEKPPMAKAPRPEMGVGARWTKTAHQAWMLVNSVRDAGGIDALVAHWEPKNWRGFQGEIHSLAVVLREWDEALERKLHDAA